jgi:hypothetical protein
MTRTASKNGGRGLARTPHDDKDCGCSHERECGDHGGVCPRVFNAEEVGESDRDDGTTNQPDPEQGCTPALDSKRRK